MKSRLFADAASKKEFPDDGLPEVAVIGRSNVGKSAFINALAGRKRMARTSGTPGKTRRIHFYRLEDAMYLVDLPGYGYAAVSKAERASWRPMVEGYLRGSRVPLRGVVLLVDVRRGPESEELALLEWLRAEGIPARMVCTKCDKLKPTELARQLRTVREPTDLPADQVTAVSSTRGTGLSSVARTIHEWTGFELQRPDGGPL